MTEKILIVAHGHPSVSKGGAEVAAYHEYAELRRRGCDVTLLARDPGPSHGGSVFSAGPSDRELFIHTSIGDHFNLRSGGGARIWREFRLILERIGPTIIHFHHFTHLGIEVLREARRTCPRAKIALTLHEYLAICHHNGQMVRPGNLSLCAQSSPRDCARCFPERAASDFFLRERYLKNLLLDVDVFIAPSEFLAARYRDWGLDWKRIVVLENGHPRPSSKMNVAVTDKEKRFRFGFFGQLNRYKGVEVMLDAFALLSKGSRARASLDIYGANLDRQSEEYQSSFGKKLEALEGSARYFGPYEHEQLSPLMESVGWVIVPSIWWENSPMVIQESFLHRVPVICSDIGGMAEKVVDGVSGLHFRVGDAQSLARVIDRACSEADLLDDLRRGITLAPTVEQWVDSQLEAIAAAPARTDAA